MILLHLERAAVMASVGVAAEVVFTAFAEPQGGKRLIGYSYIWMFPIYALLYPGLLLLKPYVGAWPWWARGPFYAAAIMVFELITGLILRATVGAAPWESNYRGKRWAVMDLVRLDYFPAWAGGALVFERAFRLIAG
jgi:hypothetical protein